jgi:hypothetical protein
VLGALVEQAQDLVVGRVDLAPQGGQLLLERIGIDIAWARPGFARRSPAREGLGTL